MAYEPKEGFGALFKNDKKTSDKHPDYKGNFRGLDGVDYDIAAWIKEGQRGKFMSLKVSEARKRDDAPKEAPAEKEELDDEIPF